MLLSRLHEILAQRQLNALFQPVANMPGQYRSHHQIATAAAEAKKQAKKFRAIICLWIDDSNRCVGSIRRVGTFFVPTRYLRIRTAHF